MSLFCWSNLFKWKCSDGQILIVKFRYLLWVHALKFSNSDYYNFKVSWNRKEFKNWEVFRYTHNKPRRFFMSLLSKKQNTSHFFFKEFISLLKPSSGEFSCVKPLDGISSLKKQQYYYFQTCIRRSLSSRLSKSLRK